MSARSIARSREREVAREESRNRRRARRASVAAAGALGAAALLAPSAQAASFTVNSRLDNGDGTCDATCTLRDAVETANLDAAADTITFAPSVNGTIRLTNGTLDILSSMQIQGPGMEQVRISGDADGNGQPDDDRVFYVYTNSVGAFGEPVTISGLTIRDGYDNGNNGAGIASYTTDLRLDAVRVTDNFASEGGGGVYIADGSLNVTRSVISDNVAADEEGGGIAAYGIAGADAVASSLVVSDSTVTGNVAYEGGKGIYVEEDLDSVLIERSTISDNGAVGHGGGGGIYLGGPEFGTGTIADTTITGNDAYYGGGIYVDNSGLRPIEILNSTIVGNTATGATASRGGGIYLNVDDATAPMTISSTIIAANTAEVAGNDLAGDGNTNIFNVGFSLIGDPAVGNNAVLNETPAGSNLLSVDPQLGPLADNGGPTKTFLPAASSPVIDAGVANGLATDQRGLPRTSQQPGANRAGSDGTDIGAVELADAGVDSPVLTAKKTQKQKGKKLKVKIKAGAAEAVTVVASGKIKKAPLKPVSADVAAGQTKTLKLKPKSKKAAKKIVKALTAGKKAKAKVSATFTDAAGNVATKKVGVKLVAKSKKK